MSKPKEPKMIPMPKVRFALNTFERGHGNSDIYNVSLNGINVYWDLTKYQARLHAKRLRKALRKEME